MHKKFSYIKQMSLLALVLISSAQAEVKINGFGSVVTGIQSDDKVFRNSPYNDELDFKPQSKFALQVSTDLGEGFSATAQIMARGQNDFDTKFEWAYLSYEINDNNTLRVGRLRLPFYKYSDYLDVGFAYPWINPPTSMYSLLFSTYDGLSLLSNFMLGDIDVTSNVIHGVVSDTFFRTTYPTDGKLKGFTGGNVTFSYESFAWFIAYMGGDIDIPIHVTNPALNGLYSNLAGKAGESKANLLIMDEDYGDFLGTGITYDDGTWLINAEWSTVAVENSMLLTSKNWYVSAGYRFGKYLPHITFGGTDTDRNTSTAQEFNGIMFTDTIPATPVVQGFLDGQAFKYKSVTLGVKYDLSGHIAMKAEYTRYSDIYDPSPGSSLGTSQDGENISLFSFGFDFVF